MPLLLILCTDREHFAYAAVNIHGFMHGSIRSGDGVLSHEIEHGSSQGPIYSYVADQ